MKNPHKLRHKARCLALQALYQNQFTEHDIETLVQQSIESQNIEKIDFLYLQELVQGVVQQMKKIDETISPFLDRSITELNPVELACLRLATYELLNRLDVPYRVVINEAVEIAKKYGSIEGYKYINGVLDKMAPKLREVEVANYKK